MELLLELNLGLNKSSPGDWFKNSHTYLLRTFWIAMHDFIVMLIEILSNRSTASFLPSGFQDLIYLVEP